MERRFYPRVATQLAAVVSASDGRALDVLVHEVSMNGLGFRCKTSERNLLTPGGRTLVEGRPVEVQVSMRLAEDSTPSSVIKAQCAVVYSRRISQDRCQVGMRFVDLVEPARSRLRDFVASRLEQ